MGGSVVRVSPPGCGMGESCREGLGPQDVIWRVGLDTGREVS